MIVYATVTVAIADEDTLRQAMLDGNDDVSDILNIMIREGKSRIVHVGDDSYVDICEALKITFCAECGCILDGTNPEQCTVYENVKRCPACLEEYIAFCNEDPDDDE